MSTRLRTRITALLAAGVLALAMGASAVGLLPTNAFAAGALVLDSTATTADLTGPGYSLTVSGLENGDTAKYYKIVEQDVDTEDDEGNTVVGTQQWKLTVAVDSDGDGVVDGTEGTSFGHKTAGPDGKIGTTDDVAVDGLYVDELYLNSYTVEDGVVTSDTRQLTQAMVNALSTAVTNNVAAHGVTPTGSCDANEDGVVSVADASSGMYMFVAVPGDNNVKYIYKPVFVSADYYNVISEPEDNTHAIALEEGVTDYPKVSGSTESVGVFKKSPLTIDKKSGTFNEDGTPIDLQQDVAVGDTIDFSITVPIVTYSKNYVAPMFYITDTLTEGLKLVEGSIKVAVKNDDDEVTVVEGKDYRIFVKGKETDETDYFDFNNTVDAKSTFDAFVVQFLNDDPNVDGLHDGFLYTVLGAPTCTITYKATVTETDKQKFAQQVNQMDNTAKLNYSKDPNYIPDGYFTTDDEGNIVPNDQFDTNDPATTDENGDPEDSGLLQDKTRHYTFDIDADVLGRDQSGDLTPGGGPDDLLPEEGHNRTSEIRKTWIDSNGQVIQKKTTSDVVLGGDEEDGVSGEEAGNYGWLEGAEFTLTKVQKHVTTFTGADDQDGTEKFQLCDEEAMKFDADSHIRVTTGGENPKSDGKGYIAMKGLDAGVYILKEIKAPLGYAFNPNVQYRITIEPTYAFEAGTNPPTPDNGGELADDLILDSYKVTIVAEELDDNLNIVGESTVTTVSTYNMKKDEYGSPASLLKDDGSSNVDPDSDPAGTGGVEVSVESFGSNETAMVVNKKLGLLPATGGSGILFYLGVGAAIMALAVGLALLKRRMNARS